jgi:hypothetical protein
VQAGHFAIARTRDPAARLAILGVHFPDIAPWDALLGYLLPPEIIGWRSASPARRLVRLGTDGWDSRVA